jgi:ATP-dependent protease ClpP protease subunit
MTDTTEQTIDWNRAIFIDGPIDDKLVVSLTPTILKLRQESNKPITVGINSPGGSLDSLDTLIGLLTNPTQKNERGRIITVVTDQAFSAAAILLAFGDYAVALKHSKILFHDVRYGEVPDVTPKKALSVSKSLSEANDAFSLRLANKVIRRLIWIFLDLYNDFSACTKKYDKFHQRYEKIIRDYAEQTGVTRPDLAAFATCLFAKISPESDSLILNSMERLLRWMVLTKLSSITPAYRQKGKRKSGLLDGMLVLHKLLDGNVDNLKLAEADLKLLITLLVGELTSKNNDNISFQGMLESAARDHSFMTSLNDEKHKSSAMRLMLRYKRVFFSEEAIHEIDASEDAKKAHIAKSMPLARLFWLFCALICRELFDGEHVISPKDAQLLGLVDEVAGGGPVESPREWSEKQKEEEKAKEKVPDHEA